MHFFRITIYMENNTEKLMAYHSGQTLPSGLLPRIISALKEQRRHDLKMRHYVFGVFSFISVPLLIWALLFTSRAIAASNLSVYLSLVFSDTSAVAAYWDNFSLLVLESLPALGLALSLMAIGFCFWSLRTLARSYYFFNKLAKQ